MSQGWVIGSRDFKRALVQEHREVAAARARGDEDLTEVQEALRQKGLDESLRKLGQTRASLASGGKSDPWKIAVAAALRQNTTATNRWMASNLHLGNLYEVSRKVNAWLRAPDPALARKLAITPNPKG